MGTQAGLLAGFSPAGVNVLGISVRHPRERQEDAVFDLAQRTTALLKTSCQVRGGAGQVNDGFVGAGYGQPTSEMIEAVRLLAEKAGILLDPVYTGKGMARVARACAGRSVPSRTTSCSCTPGDPPAC